MKDFDCIVAVGCSHMFGYEHFSTNENIRPSNQTWVNHIGKHLNVPVYNFSQPGASNQTILRRLMIALEHSKRKKLKPFFVLQWTEIQRYETMVTLSTYKSEDWPWLRPMLELHNKSSNDTLTKWAEDFYKLYDKKTLLFETLKSIKHANLELQQQGFDVLNCLAQGWDLDSYNFESHPAFVSSSSVDPECDYSKTLRDWYVDRGYQQHKGLSNEHYVEAYEKQNNNAYSDEVVLSLLWDQIGDYPWWFYNRGWTHGMKKFCLENNLEIGPKGHPMESAHNVVYQYMMDDENFVKMIKNK